MFWKKDWKADCIQDSGHWYDSENSQDEEDYSIQILFEHVCINERKEGVCGFVCFFIYLCFLRISATVAMMTAIAMATMT